MSTDPTYQYGLEDIQRYLSGSMSAAEMHQMEKAALADPMLADALEGFREVKPAVADEHLNAIRSGIHAQKTELQKAIPVVKMKPASSKWWRGLAAAVAIGILAWGAWFVMQPKNETGNIAENKPAGTEVPPTLQPQSPEAPVPDSVIVTEQIAPVKHPQTQQVQDELLKNVPSPAPIVAPPVTKSLEAPSALDKEVASSVAADAVMERAIVPSEAPAASQSKKQVQVRGYSAPQSNALQNDGMLARRSPFNSFTGKVVDQLGNPIPGVTISIPEKNTSTVSNIDGSFRLQAPDSINTLAFTQVGYQKKTEKMLAGKAAGIQLEPTDEALNEVVVIGYGGQKKGTMVGAASRHKVDTLPYKESPYPQGGWDNFYNNLSSEMGVNQSRATKDLHLRFTIEDGIPSNFTVIKAPNQVTAQKAISIIKKGPGWKSDRRKKKRVDLKMKVD